MSSSFAVVTPVTGRLMYIAVYPVDLFFLYFGQEVFLISGVVFKCNFGVLLKNISMYFDCAYDSYDRV
jgi:hypothetical protein